MTVTETKQGETTVLRLQGRLDAAGAPVADRRLVETIDSGVRQLVVELSGVEYVSSAGLRVLLAAAKRMQQVQGRMALASPTTLVRQTLETAGFPTVLPLLACVPEAVARTAATRTPAVASTPAPVPLAHGPLSFAEEVFLLALDDQAGVLRPLAAPALGYALAGALLMELALAGRIETDLAVLKVTSAAPTGDALLDWVLGELQRAAVPQSTAYWLRAFANHADRVEGRVLARLVDKGILKQESRRILWVFQVRRYPLIDNREITDVRTRLRQLILSSDIPDPRDVVLISLGNACRLLDELFTAVELNRVHSRIGALARLDLIGQEMSNAVRDVEHAMTAALMSLKL